MNTALQNPRRRRVTRVEIHCTLGYGYSHLGGVPWLFLGTE